jgi:hypothetical protein
MLDDSIVTHGRSPLVGRVNSLLGHSAIWSASHERAAQWVMAIGVGDRISLRDVTAAVGTSQRSRLMRAVVVVPAAVAAVAFVGVLPPGASEMAVASAAARTLDSAPDAPAPVPIPPLPPGLPAPFDQEYATAMQALQNATGAGPDVTSSDDDDAGGFDTTQADEQQQGQLQQDQDDQTQAQLNTDEENQVQSDLDTEQQAQERNDEAQQQVDDGLQEAQQTEIDAGQ